MEKNTNKDINHRDKSSGKAINNCCGKQDSRERLLSEPAEKEINTTDYTPSFSCAECKVKNCYHQQKKYPNQCPTRNMDEQEIIEVIDFYNNDEELLNIMQAAAEIEGKHYGKLTRLEETLALAEGLGINKIGIAACLGLLAETAVFAGIARKRGLDVVCMVCKVGSIDKSRMGIQDEFKLSPGRYEATCNPLLQARLLNREKTGLNVVIGLCVGHDAIFYRHSAAPATTLVVKDRVLGHNPAAAIYTHHTYYQKILNKPLP